MKVEREREGEIERRQECRQKDREELMSISHVVRRSPSRSLTCSRSKRRRRCPWPRRCSSPVCAPSCPCRGSVPCLPAAARSGGAIASPSSWDQRVLLPASTPPPPLPLAATNAGDNQNKKHGRLKEQTQVTL